MENIGAGVGAVPAHEKKEEYKKMKNKVIFFYGWDKEFYIYAVGEWRENADGVVVGDVDTYFYTVLTGQRCEHLRDCLIGWVQRYEETPSEWETLFKGIEKLPNLTKTICTRKKVIIW